MTQMQFTEGFDEVTRDDWLALVAKVLKGADFDDQLLSRTADGLRIEPLYTRGHALEGAVHAVPGAAPFTRGTRASLDGLGWDIRQFHGEPDPKAANKAILEDLAGGATSITLQLEAPGQYGLPPSRDSLQEALADIDLSICPIALQGGENFALGAELLRAAWKKRNIAGKDRQGAFNADPLGAAVRSGGLSRPFDQAVEAAATLMAQTQDLPRVTASLADGRPYHAAGASEAQELAAMLATLIAYLRAAESEGIAPDKALPKIAIALAADTDQFLTIAKLRAARRLIWRVADAARIGEAAGAVHLSVETAPRMMARRDPWVNMLRTTIACAGAAMGGADAITVLPFTWALGKPDGLARRIARNTQIVLHEEASLGRVSDPAGGSWYVEKLTDDLARAAWGIFQQIEARGGMAAALQAGFVQDMIAATAEERAQQIATGHVPLTGVTAFPKLGDDGVNVTPYPGAMPANVKGQPIRPLELARLAEPFEALRDAADAYAGKTGNPPRVFLANLGSPADFNARAAWAKNFFAAGGIDTLTSDGFTNSVDVGAAFAKSGAGIACICSSDEVYGELAEAVAGLLKQAGAKAVYLAGRPGDFESVLREAGVDAFVYSGCDMIGALSKLHDILGVPSKSAS